MSTKKTDDCEEEWQAAEVALKTAQKMPCGQERIEALKRAGQLRYEAGQRRRSSEPETDHVRSAARRPN
jgi:hypothetical protein